MIVIWAMAGSARADGVVRLERCDDLCGYLEQPPPSPDEKAALYTLTAGLSIFTVSYLVGTTYALSLPHPNRAFDLVPVIGAIGSADRNRDPATATHVLIFSAGTQAVGILLAVLSAVEYHRALEERRLSFQLGPTPGGAAFSLSGSFR
jgi:hypothetical protein